MKHFSTICLTVFIFISIDTSAQTPPSKLGITIAEILGAMPAGRILPDGKRVYCQKVATGTGDNSDPTFGSIISSAGNALDGYNGTPPAGYVPTDAIVLSQFTGSRVLTSFSRVNAPFNSIGGGTANNFQNSVGFHLYWSSPVNNVEMAALDVDGSTTNNAEWFSCFSFLAGSYKKPLVSYAKNASGVGIGVERRANPTVSSSWNTLLNSLTNLPALHDTFRTTTANPTLVPPNPFIIYRANQSGNADPDDTTAQGVFYYNSASDYVDHFVLLFGVLQSVSTNSAPQYLVVSSLTQNVTTDFGDAPETYHSSIANNGASHTIWSSLRIGDTTITSADGSADAMAGTAPGEDGVAMVNSISTTSTTGSQSGMSYSVSVKVRNQIEKNAQLIAWIDWNNNGVFDAAEAQTATVGSMAGAQTINLQWTNQTINNIALGKTYMRIRLSTDPLLNASKSFGYLSDGEVEDYKIVINNTPLAVGVIKATASWMNNDAQINWTTATENDYNRFDIERSTDAIHFENIGSVEAAGHSDVLLKYSFVDYNAADICKDAWYYRLKVHTDNGLAQYSNIVALNKMNRNDAAIIIYPNPASKVVQFNSLANVNSIAITTIDGKMLKQFDVANINSNAINVEALPGGAYIFTLYYSNHTSTQHRVVVIK